MSVHNCSCTFTHQAFAVAQWACNSALDHILKPFQKHATAFWTTAQQLTNTGTLHFCAFRFASSSVHFWLFLIKFSFLWYSHGMQKENGKSYNKHLCWFFFPCSLARTPLSLALAKHERISCCLFSALSIPTLWIFVFSFQFLYFLFSYFLIFFSLFFPFLNALFSLTLRFSWHASTTQFSCSCLLTQVSLDFSFSSMIFPCLHNAFLLVRFSFFFFFLILNSVKSTRRMNENFHLKWNPLASKRQQNNIHIRNGTSLFQ